MFEEKEEKVAKIILSILFFMSFSLKQGQVLPNVDYC